MKATARQLDLPCTFEQASALQEQVDRLNGLCALLYDEQGHLQDQLHTANAACDAWRERHRLTETKLAAAHAEIALLQTNLAVARRVVLDREPPIPAWLSLELRRLLTVCHPDKWAQGQPATALAHEAATALNALRERLEEGMA